MTEVEQLKQQAREYFESGNYHESLELCRKMIALEPENSGHYLKAASNHQQLGQYEGARELYDKAISIDPKEALGFSGRGMIQAALGDIDQAIGSFTKAIELSPSAPEFYTQRGTLLLQRASDECSVYLAYLRQGKPAEAASYRAKCIAELKRGISDLTSAHMKGSDSPTLPNTIDETTRFIEDLESEEAGAGLIAKSADRLEKEVTQM